MTPEQGIGFTAQAAKLIGRLVGKIIHSVTIEKSTDGDALSISFQDGCILRLRDDPQCCELRYMVCDDDLGPFQGARFLGANLSDGGYTKDRDGDIHEILFMDILTSLGPFQVATHNVHNGYYSGFNIIPHVGFPARLDRLDAEALRDLDVDLADAVYLLNALLGSFLEPYRCPLRRPPPSTF